MTLSAFIPAVLALALMQLVAYFSARSVLGPDAGWRINNTLGFACIFTTWGSIYAGLLAHSFTLGLVFFISGVTLVVYGLRRRSTFTISIKQGLLIYGGVVLRLVLVSAMLGAIARGLIFITKRLAAS